MSTFYRAKLVLQRVTDNIDDRGYPRGQADEIASIDVTAATPGDAVFQMQDHAAVLARSHPRRATGGPVNTTTATVVDTTGFTAHAWLKGALDEMYKPTYKPTPPAEEADHA